MDTKVSVIIPSLDGNRGGNLEKLKEQLKRQSLQPLEIIVVTGISPNGKARNEGAVKACGEYLVFIDDDVSLGNEKVIENLVKPFKETNNIGMTGPSQLIPEGSSWFQMISSKQIPRSSFPVQDRLIDSDMVTHTCLCMSANLFKEIGMENPNIVSGTDPDLRYRVRNAGYRICVVPDTWAYHPMPDYFTTLMSKAFARGQNSAEVRINSPDMIFELGEGYNMDFIPKRNLFFRFLRMCYRTILCLFSGKFIAMSYMLSYSAGNILHTIRRNLIH